jgi:predicted Fe-Mo cluster-binding NifX family protein
MKIAVTSKGKLLDADIDPRFGRAAFILIVDTDSLDFEVIDNSVNVNAFKGAGIKAAATICEKGAEVLATGYCGPKAFTTIAAANIKLICDISGTVRDVVSAFIKGELKYSNSANADAHW